MGMSRSRCVDPHKRIDQVIDAVDDLNDIVFEGVVYTAGCGIDVTGTVITARVDGTSIVCVDGVLSAIAASDITAGCGISIDAGEVSVVVDDTTIACTDGTLHVIAGVFTTDAFTTITVTGNLGPHADIIAETSSDTLNLVFVGGIFPSTDAATDTLTITVPVGAGMVAGCHMAFDDDELSVVVDTLPAAQGGLEVVYGSGDDCDTLRDKWRFHYIKGQATGAVTPGNPGLDNTSAIHGEEPSDPVTTHGLQLYCANNDVIYAKFDNEGASGVESDSWTTDTMANIRPIMAGFDDYAPASTMLLGHFANSTSAGQQNVQWKTIEDWLKTLPGYSASADQYLKNETGTIKWVTAAEC